LIEDKIPIATGACIALSLTLVLKNLMVNH